MGVVGKIGAAVDVVGVVGVWFWILTPTVNDNFVQSLVDTAGQTLGVLNVAYNPNSCQTLTPIRPRTPIRRTS